MKTNEPDCILIKKRDYEILKSKQDDLIHNYETKIKLLNQEIGNLKNTPPQIDPIKLTINLVEEIRRFENGYCKEHFTNILPYLKEANVELDKPLRNQILRISGIIAKRIKNERQIKVEEINTSIYNYLWTTLSEMSFFERISYINRNIKKHNNETK